MKIYTTYEIADGRQFKSSREAVKALGDDVNDIVKRLAESQPPDRGMNGMTRWLIKNDGLIKRYLTLKDEIRETELHEMHKRSENDK